MSCLQSMSVTEDSKSWVLDYETKIVDDMVVILTPKEQMTALFESVRKYYSRYLASRVLANDTQYDIDSFREAAAELYLHLYEKEMSDEYFEAEVTKLCKTKEKHKKEATKEYFVFAATKLSKEEEEYAQEEEDYYSSDGGGYW